KGTLDAEGWKLLGQESMRNLMRSPDPDATAAKLRALAAPIPDEARHAFLTRAAAMASWNDRPLAFRLAEFLSPDSLSEAMGRWAGEDPTAASAWLATMTEPSPKRDAAVAALCRVLAP